MNDYFLQIMKRTKVQRGYLAQNPYKRAKFYDQGFENVRNPPRTPHLQTYGKKYDLMKLLQVVTALMQLKKNEENKSPVVQFKEGMKRNMERIKPAMRAAEQHFLGKPALDTLYRKTIDEIGQMLRQRTDNGYDKALIKALMNETEEGRKKAYYENAGRYEGVAELIKDLVNQYKGNNRNLRMLASKIDADLARTKNYMTERALKNATSEAEKAKIEFAIDREFREFFNPANLSEGSLADNSGLRSIYPIFHKQALPDPTIIDISSANAILDGLEDDVGVGRTMEAEKIYYDPQNRYRRLYKKLIGEDTSRQQDLILTEEYVKEHPELEDILERAKSRIEQVTSGSNVSKRSIKNANKPFKALERDFKEYMDERNHTPWTVPTIPIQPTNTGSNIPLAPEVFMSLALPSLPPMLPP